MKNLITLSIKITDDSDNYKDTVPEPAVIIGKQDLTEQAKIEFDLNPGDSDVQQSFGRVDSAKVLYILTTADISFKLNASNATAIPIKVDKVSGLTKYGFFAGTPDGITSLYFSNAGTTTAKVTMYIAS